MSLKSKSATACTSIVLAATTMLGAAMPAHATDFTNSNGELCPSGIGTVGVALDAVGDAIDRGEFTRTADQTNLLVKLANANSKTLLAKWDDAIDKLQDISDKATDLAGAPKPKLDSADDINTAVVAAIACLTFPN